MNMYRENFYKEHKQLIEEIYVVLDMDNQPQYLNSYNNMCINYYLYNVENECKRSNPSIKKDKIQQIKLTKKDININYNLWKVLKKRNINTIKKLNLILLKTNNYTMMYYFNELISSLRILKNKSKNIKSYNTA